MRILHLADLHLDRAFARLGCPPAVGQRRRQGLRDALRRAGDAAVERGCSAVTIGGDLFEHEHADLETGRFLAEVFASWSPLLVAVAPGNHDPLLPDSLYRRTDWPGNVHLFTETVLRPLPLADGLTLWGLAHRDPSWAGDPLVTPPVGGDGGVHLALFHGAELGSRPPGKSVHGPFRAERIAERGFALALCGHYHRRRMDSQTRLLYPGSPEPLTFDEEGGRGPVVVDVAPDGAVAMEAVDLSSWTALTVDCTVDGLRSSAAVLEAARDTAARAVRDLDPDRSMLRLTLVGELPADVAVERNRLEAEVADASRAAVVRVRDLSSAALDLTSARSDPTARGAFARAVLEQLDTAEEERRPVLEDALRYGLQALAGVEVGLR